MPVVGLVTSRTVSALALASQPQALLSFSPSLPHIPPGADQGLNDTPDDSLLLILANRMGSLFSQSYSLEELQGPRQQTEEFPT